MISTSILPKTIILSQSSPLLPGIISQLNNTYLGIRLVGVSETGNGNGKWEMGNQGEKAVTTRDFLRA